MLAPLAGAVAGLIWLMQSHSLWESLRFGFRGGLAAFVAWALARELAPDDNPAAFAAMALGWTASVAWPSSSLLLAFAVLVAVRIVNRTVGIPATPLDSAAALLLLGWVMYESGSPWPGVLGALAFALDATLPEPRRRQWIPAALSLAAAVAVLAWRGLPGRPPPSGLPLVAAGLIAAAWLIVIAGTTRVQASGDRTGEPLRLVRVRAGMVTAWVAVVPGTFLESPVKAVPIWSVLATLSLAFLVRRLMTPQSPRQP